jgi:hypothetical protein
LCNGEERWKIRERRGGIDAVNNEETGHTVGEKRRVIGVTGSIPGSGFTTEERTGKISSFDSYISSTLSIFPSFFPFPLRG